MVGTVRGHFLMPGGAPIPFGTVRLIAGGRAIGQVTTAGSGDLGSFSFSYVPAGPLRLEALDPAHRDARAWRWARWNRRARSSRSTCGRRRWARWRATSPATAPPSRARWWTSPPGRYRVSTAADTQGLYRVAGVPEGRVTVQASLADGYLKALRSETLLGEGTVLTMDMALRPTGTVEGAVTEADGETPALAVVSLWVGGLGGGNFARPTSEAGEFEFERVASGAGSISADELASIDRADATIEVPGRADAAGADAPQRRGLAARDGAGLGRPAHRRLAAGRWARAAYRDSRALNVGPNGEFVFGELMAGPFTLTLQHGHRRHHALRQRVGHDRRRTRRRCSTSSSSRAAPSPAPCCGRAAAVPPSAPT